MPNIRLAQAWIPLTVIVTIAIYLHLRGFPSAVDTAGTAVPSPVDELAPTDESNESNCEAPATNETVDHPGEKASFSII